jgi:hypothetical protein
VGSWIGSMMSNMWVYDGVMASEGALELHAEGPSFHDPGKVARYKDVLEFRSNDHRLLNGFVFGNDGQWQHFMTTEYRRVR